MRSICLILLFLVSTFVGADAQSQSSWRLDKDQDGVRVYLRNTAGSAVKSFKGSVTINGSLSSVLAVIEDTKAYPRWLHNCKSAKVLKGKDASQVISYVVTDMPWPVADRDAVISASRTQNKNNKRVEIKFNAEPNLAAKVNGKVRIGKMQGRWLLTPLANNQVNVIYEMNLDPGGNIPKWLVNSMVVDLPFHTLSNLRKISKEEQYAKAKIIDIMN